MKKSFGLMVLALLVVPLLAACSSESADVSESFMEALLKGDADAAQQYACESFQEGAARLAAYFARQNVRDWDLKYDIGKGNRQEEIIVTGAFQYGPEDAPRELKLQERSKTRIVLWLEQRGDDWCVTDRSEFGEVVALGGGLEAPAGEGGTSSGMNDAAG